MILDKHKKIAINIIILLLILSLFSLTLLAKTSNSLSKNNLSNNQDNKAANGNDKAEILELNKIIKKEINNNSSHLYQVKLAKKQYLHIDIERKGVDLLARVLDPNGKKLFEVDSFSEKYGKQPVLFIAEEDGNYQLEIVSDSSLMEETTKSYQIKIVDLRLSTTKDVEYIANRLNARQVFDEAQRLYQQKTKNSLEKALEKYLQALSLYQNLSDSQSEAVVYSFIAITYINLGDNLKALELYNKALSIWQILENKFHQAYMLSTIAELHNTILGNNQEALKYFQQSLEIINSLRESIGDSSLEANVLFNLTKVHIDLGNNQEALKLAEKTLDLYNKLKMSPGIFDTLCLTSTIYSNTGENQKAIELLNKALKIPTDSDNNLDKSPAYNALGVIYQRLGDNKRALKFLEMALAIREVIGEPVGKSEVLFNIASIYTYQKEYKKALKYLNEVLQTHLDIGDHVAEAFVRNAIGVVYLDQKKYDVALKYLNEALTLHKEIGNRSGEANTLFNIGLVYFDRDSEKALDYFSSALEIWKNINRPSDEVNTLLNIALIKRKNAELYQALDLAEKGLKIVESLRTEIKVEELRSSYFASVQNLYKFYVSLLMQLHKTEPTKGYDVKALLASESSRARTLLEFIKQGKIDIRKNVDTKLLKREADLRHKFNEKSNTLLKIRNNSEQDDRSKNQIIILQREIDEITRQLEEVELDIKNNSPAYAALTQPKTVTLEEIQKQALDEDTILLEYFLGQTHSYVWLITANSITSYELAKEEDINSVAEKLYDSLSSGSFFRSIREKQKAKKEYIEYATKLSNLILSPISNKLDKKRLVIVPDGILHSIPFSVLADPKMQSHISINYNSFSPLILNYDVVNEPSASVLASLRQKQQKSNFNSKEIIFFADPVFGKDDERLKKIVSNKKSNNLASANIPKNSSYDYEPILEKAKENGVIRSGNSLPRLSFTASEATNIAKLFPTEQSQLCIGFSANLEKIINKDLTQYKFIHFATHGLVDRKDPKLTALVLSLVDEQGNERPGFLTLNEIFNLNLSAEMVTLSACQTGLGKEIPGEGLIGMTRGFIYAGAKRIVVSLWNVNDKSTAELMIRFYKQMLDNKDFHPAEALRAAQLSIMKEPQWQLPYYWAAFQIQGEW